MSPGTAHSRLPNGKPLIVIDSRPFFHSHNDLDAHCVCRQCQVSYTQHTTNSQRKWPRDGGETVIRHVSFKGLLLLVFFFIWSSILIFTRASRHHKNRKKPKWFTRKRRNKQTDINKLAVEKHRKNTIEVWIVSVEFFCSAGVWDRARKTGRPETDRIRLSSHQTVKQLCKCRPNRWQLVIQQLAPHTVANSTFSKCNRKAEMAIQLQRQACAQPQRSR